MLLQAVRLLYIFMTASYAIHLFKRDYVSPNLLFTLTQLFMFLGITLIADVHNDADIQLMVCYCVAFPFYMFGTELAFQHKGIPFKAAKYDLGRGMTHVQVERVLLVMVVSVIVCALFFIRAGGNVAVKAIRSVFSSSDIANYTEDRLSMNGMTGVGYVYQFRTVLLPITMVIAIAMFEKYRKLFIFVGAPIMVLFLLGTGQRGAFVTFIIVVMCLLTIIVGAADKLTRAKYRRIGVAIIVVGTLLFLIMTISNGRDSVSGSLWAAVTDRFLKDNQNTALVAFRYICTQPTQWGRDWCLTFLDILPGKNEYIPLASQVFSIMYGTTRGTSPECIWGSAFYNWSYLGVTLFPLILGYLSERIYTRFVSQTITLPRAIIYSGLYVYLGLWFAGTPMVLFNQGLVTVALLGLILHIDSTGPVNSYEKSASDPQTSLGLNNRVNYTQLY